MKLLQLCMLACLSFFPNDLLAQKPLIDTAAFKKWPDLQAPNISNNGKYVRYTVHNNEINQDTLVIQSTDAHWRKSILNAISYQVSFTANSRKLIYITQNDTLFILDLENSHSLRIPNVTSFIPVKDGIGDWLIYKEKGSENKLITYNLETGKKRSYSGVINHLLSNDGRTLILQKSISDNHNMQSLEWVTLEDGTIKSIWKGIEANNLTFDQSNNQLAFLAIQNDCDNCKLLFCYNSSINKTELVIRRVSDIGDTNLEIDRIKDFSDDGKKIFFYLSEREKPTPQYNPDAVELNVWSYTDSKLQSLQLKELDNVKSYLAVVNIIDKHIIRLEAQNERATPLNDKYILIEHKDGDAHESEWSWNPAFKNTKYLVSIESGQRIPLTEVKDYMISASPKGNFFIYYDTKRETYFSYEIATRITRDITKGLLVKWSPFYMSSIARGIASWLPNDENIIIYDQFDIWQIDPLCKRSPINLTNGFGLKNKIVFKLTSSPLGKTDFPFGDKINLTAFNVNTKSNGFYQITKGRKRDPELLTMGPYSFDLFNMGSGDVDRNSFIPSKALQAEKYIVKRSSATNFGNYYSTVDFKTFTQLSNIRPEKAFNWYTTELHTWKSLTGNLLHGILYKPENFDSTKKYPIIFHYYDRKSDGLNVYLKPEAVGGSINIPTFVSNGYLLVALDIEYTTGEVGQSAIDAIVPAANYFSKMPFIDGKKMGITGFSFGGYVTNYIITHTKIFAAASTGAGRTDLVSTFGGLKDNTYSGQEMSQLRMGATLWERPDLYIKNSPIFNVQNVITPLLMMHTSYDGAVEFSQAIEFFTALRRLGKKVWLLEYKDGNHGIFGKSKLDYSKRMMQFFDYYLKNKPAPIWMLDGIPAKLKGIETGLELDTTGRKPRRGLVEDSLDQSK